MSSILQISQQLTYDLLIWAINILSVSFLFLMIRLHPTRSLSEYQGNT